MGSAKISSEGMTTFSKGYPGAGGTGLGREELTCMVVFGGGMGSSMMGHEVARPSVSSSLTTSPRVCGALSDKVAGIWTMAVSTVVVVTGTNSSEAKPKRLDGGEVAEEAGAGTDVVE